MHSRKVVFLTGATGNMGSAALGQLLEKSDQYRLKILVLPSECNNPAIPPYMGHPQVEIIWGELTCYDDVLRGVDGADFVLHIGAMVSPLADRFPDLTMKVNFGGTHNIVRAVRAQPDPDRVRLVYIGTVAETGSRMAPIHWGRTGDPIKLSIFDHYALSKTMAEAVVAESGLKHWVSLRQTGILHTNMKGASDPIMFHVPINGVFEWITVEDSGRLMANICEDAVPDNFWRAFYNIGGGASCRMVNHEFMAKTYAATGIRDMRKVVEPRWFATRNFHGQWYTDSDRLEALVPFRRQSVTDYFALRAQSIPLLAKAVGWIAPGTIGNHIEALAMAPGGPLYWITHGMDEYVTAYFGSRAAWNNIPGWDDYKLEQPSPTPNNLDHGYDESKDKLDWTVHDLREAARFRGGRYISDYAGDPYALASWRCALGHDFRVTPNLMLAGGHWCPICMAQTSYYPEVARRSPYFAQVWQEGEITADRLQNCEAVVS